MATGPIALLDGVMAMEPTMLERTWCEFLTVPLLSKDDNSVEMCSYGLWKWSPQKRHFPCINPCVDGGAIQMDHVREVKIETLVIDLSTCGKGCALQPSQVPTHAEND